MQNGKGFNERKREILQLLSQGEKTSREIAERIGGTDTSSVSSYLVNYRGQGLVTARRHEEDGRKFVYSLTERGEERLDWLAEERGERGEQEA